MAWVNARWVRRSARTGRGARWQRRGGGRRRGWVGGGRGSRAGVAKAWREWASRLAVKVAWHGVTGAAADVVDALYVADDPVSVALDPRSPSATLCGQLAERGIVVARLGPEDVAVAHGEFRGLVATGQLRQFEQAGLPAAVRGAQERPLSGAGALEPRLAARPTALQA